jgi:cytochrome c556
MKLLRGLACLFAILSAVMATWPALADDQDVVDYRRHIMKTLGEQVAIIGMILEKKAPAEALATHADVLAITAKTAKAAFESEIRGGDAKPEVWGKWADFSKRMDALVVAADDLAKSSKQGAAVAGPKVKSLNCKNCHDTYRVPK